MIEILYIVLRASAYFAGSLIGLRYHWYSFSIFCACLVVSAFTPELFAFSWFDSVFIFLIPVFILWIAYDISKHLK